MTKDRTATPLTPPAKRPRRPVSPYMRISPTERNKQKRGLRVIDGTSPEANFLRRCTAMLTEHVGGNPTLPQSALISQIGWIELRLLLLNKKAMDGSEGPNDVNTYLAHANSLKRLYSQLGIQKPRPDLATLLKRRPGRPRRPDPEAA